MRGKLARSHRLRDSLRLIPAYAGKTFELQGFHCLPPAHPRVCGENSLLALFAAGTMGSSPRIRGKPLDDELAIGQAGLIPAYAGKTYQGCQIP